MTDFLLSFQDRSLLFGIFTFAVLCLRFIVISGGPYLIAWKWMRKRLSSRRIQADFKKPIRIGGEVIWSLVSFAVLGVLASCLHALFRAGHTRLIMDWAAMSWPYHAFSLVLLFLIHDAYFYWMHRILHHPYLFRKVHAVHHYSINPTPFAAFSFHPIEAVTEMLFLFPVLVAIPIHIEVLISFLVFSHFFNVIGHLGYELFPKGTWDAWWGSWITTSTHHNLHHQYFTGNYGLYLKMWDKVCGTLHPKTELEFKRITDGQNEVRP